MASRDSALESVKPHWRHVWLGPGGALCAAAPLDGHGLARGVWLVVPGDKPRSSMPRAAHASAIVTIRAAAAGPAIGVIPRCRQARDEAATAPRLGIVLRPWVQAAPALEAIADRLRSLCSGDRRTRVCHGLPTPEMIVRCLAGLDGPAPEACILDLTRSLEVSPTRASLAASRRRSGLTARTLRRKVHAWIGLTPDVLRRIGRAEAARRKVGFSPRDLSQLAFDLDFADQAHMTREFVALCGFTPQGWRRHVRQWRPAQGQKG